MSDKSAEHVLVIATREFHQLGVFQGFCSEAAAYLPQLLDPAKLSYLPRSQAEQDAAFKQLIPYIVLRWRDQVFHYRRGAGGTETRLQARRSIGIGGHILPATRSTRAILIELGCGVNWRRKSMCNVRTRNASPD